MFGLFSRKKPKLQITAAKWWDENGNVLGTAEFDPPLTNIHVAANALPK